MFAIKQKYRTKSLDFILVQNKSHNNIWYGKNLFCVLYLIKYRYKIILKSFSFQVSEHFWYFWLWSLKQFYPKVKCKQKKCIHRLSEWVCSGMRERITLKREISYIHFSHLWVPFSVLIQIWCLCRYLMSGGAFSVKLLI